MKSTKILPYLALVSGLAALAISPFFVRWANAPGPVTTFYRVLTATIFLAPFFARSVVKSPFKLDRATLLFPILGGISMTLDLICWSMSIQYTRVSTATLLGNTAPLWVALVAWLFFKEKLKKVFWLGLVLAMAGVVTVMGGDIFYKADTQSAIGDLLGLGSGLFYGGYFLAGQLGRRNNSTIRHLWLMDAASVVTLGLFVLANGWRFTGYDTQTWMAFLGAGVVTQIIGYFSIIYALGHLPASLVSPTLIGQPVLVALLGIPLVGEFLQPYQWLGGLVVLAGILIIHRSREKEPQPEALPAPEVAGN